MKRRRISKGTGKYRVGRGKPPKKNQFPPGVSGNPKGRPKGSKNIAKVIAKELNKPVIVTENGSRRRVDKTTAMVMRLVQKALEGDPKSLNSILAMVERSSVEQPPEEPPTRFEIDLLRKYFSYLEGLLNYADQLDRAQAA